MRTETTSVLARMRKALVSRARACTPDPEAVQATNLPLGEATDSPAADSGTEAASSPLPHQETPGSQPIDGKMLRAASPTILAELAQRIVPGAVSQTAALDEVLLLVFGTHRSAEERLLFMAFASRFARKFLLDRADRDQRLIESDDVTVADIREVLDWCDTFEPMSASMLDMHYVAGISVRQIARALQLHPNAVIRDLRFTKDSLRIKLDRFE